MKLAISNIAWAEAQSNEIYAVMRECGICGLEIAPSKIFGENPYEKMREACQFRNSIEKNYGLKICSMQSIWYGHTERLFGSSEERRILTEYTKKAIDFAEMIGCGNLVFGCPKNRWISSESDRQLALDFFTELVKYAENHHTVLAIEANPEIYGTNYINRTEEAFEIVKKIDSSGIKVNYDFGTVLYNKESLELLRSNISLVNHVHISEPYLERVKWNSKHEELLDILLEEKYDRFVSIEMKQQTIEQVMECMETLKAFSDKAECKASMKIKGQ